MRLFFLGDGKVEGLGLNEELWEQAMLAGRGKHVAPTTLVRWAAIKEGEIGKLMFALSRWLVGIVARKSVAGANAACVAPDGSTPCTYCLSIGKTCSYEPVKRGPPKTYVESLEQRMEAMEALLRNLSASSGIDLVAMMDESEAGSPEDQLAMEKVVESIQQRNRGTPEASTPTRPLSPDTANVVDNDELMVDKVVSRRFETAVAPGANPSMPPPLAVSLHRTQCRTLPCEEHPTRSRKSSSG